LSAAAAMRRRNQSGFTLLEVLIALTICAMALASLFAVIAGSKQLTYRARGALEESIEISKLATLPLLVDETGELLVPVENSDYRISLVLDEFEPPERKTESTTETLYQYEIEDPDGKVVAGGTYWVTLEEAE
jgi:prepilin-type N-terminal cleavage/methylation domain-containing protein